VLFAAVMECVFSNASRCTWLALDTLVVLLALTMTRYHAPRYGAGHVIARHYEYLGRYPLCPVEHYQFRVTVVTATGDQLRLRCRRELVFVLEWGDYYHGEVDE
jgi:hypothetical protein